MLLLKDLFPLSKAVFHNVHLKDIIGKHFDSEGQSFYMHTLLD
jgi:hypothetical protein